MRTVADNGAFNVKHLQWALKRPSTCPTSFVCERTRIVPPLLAFSGDERGIHIGLRLYFVPPEYYRCEGTLSYISFSVTSVVKALTDY